MDQPTIEALKVISAAKAAMMQSVQFAANEYANGGGRAKPIVDAHYTAGNQARYGWAPLSREYFLAKARGIVKHGGGKLSKPPQLTKAEFAHLARGRAGSKLDKVAGFRSSTGTMSGQGTGTNLPMLVASGELREAANSRQHKVEVNLADGTVTVWFLLPDYAKFLHEGTGKMPKRSPVDPNPADLAAIHAAVDRRISMLTGKGGAVPITVGAIPGQARVL